MERLTYKKGEHYYTNDSCIVEVKSLSDNGADVLLDCIDKLGEYEDAEEQGLLLRLPCKIGDIVYSVTRDFVSEYTICSIEKYNEGFFFNWRCEKGIYINIRGFTDYDIGKTVFLTKEEAEQALKQMGE